ncbi:caspase family protein, partial [Bosea sp. LjRoot90]|uniref:caspase family protein n=1 Tax=Bosea sp. LjRoot90 TaxID=3342342 RepID=UPI003F509AD2
MSPGSTEQRRLALVIGNGSYRFVPPLNNAKNDAESFAEALDRLDFSVSLGTDLNQNSMEDLIRSFEISARSSDVALLYYAGHGIQVYGQNYMIPIDAIIQSQDQLQRRAFNLNDHLGVLSNFSGINIIFLDACRDNPFAKTLSNDTQVNGITRGFLPSGLAAMVAKRGTFIAYATDPNNTAVDGAQERHSPFTEALLQHIEQPELSLSQIMTRVRKQVKTKTGGRQTPWDQSSLEEDFFFSIKNLDNNTADDRPTSFSLLKVDSSNSDSFSADRSPSSNRLSFFVGMIFIAVTAVFLGFTNTSIRCNINYNDICALTEIGKQKNKERLIKIGMEFPHFSAIIQQRMIDVERVSLEERSREEGLQKQLEIV